MGSLVAAGVSRALCGFATWVIGQTAARAVRAPDEQLRNGFMAGPLPHRSLRHLIGFG
jgi:hypothetical protein